MERWKKNTVFRNGWRVGCSGYSFWHRSKGSLTIVDANGKKLYAEVAKRLIPCIWNGSKVPVDYVNRAVQKASTPLAYKERKNWERVLTLACSFVKKNRKEKYKEEWNVALDKEQKDRNYLYGRLLAWQIELNTEHMMRVIREELQTPRGI